MDTVPVSPQTIERVRSFNRFYTRQIGLLREGFLDTPFSLTQGRVLYELGKHSKRRSADVAAELGLDPGYLSRLLKSFMKKRLVKRSRSREDGRVNWLSLTPQGRAEFEILNSRSQVEIHTMLSKMSVAEQQRLVNSMATILESLGGPSGTEEPVRLRTHQPGDIGWVIERHGALYAQEYGWDSGCEAFIAEIAGKFLANFDEQRERCWIAERNGERLGSVFLVKESETEAKLRLLLVEPSARGLGVGSKLVEECIAFARKCGYRKVSLWTNDVLHAARRIYEHSGFQLVREEKHHSFGQDLVGQYWELDLEQEQSAH
jgi:DNA-binding MarR family transcriptional regulator/GNAT superfamily N-acetyltransferase